MKKLLLIISIIAVVTACNNSKKTATSEDSSCESTSACAGCPSASSCGSASADDVVLANENAAVKVIYFHATRRCETCNAVEAVTKEVIADMESSDISFHSVNREEDVNKALVEKYKVSGQTLILMNSSKTVDLTSQAFLYARKSPEKLKEILKTTISELK